jgi:hypothetical protein
VAEVERVVAARESGATWKEAARAAGLEDRPAKYRSWVRGLGATFQAVMVMLPALELGLGEGWIGRLRDALGISTAEPVVLTALRWRLFHEHKLVLGPPGLVAVDRARCRDPPSTSFASYAGA